MAAQMHNFPFIISVYVLIAKYVWRTQFSVTCRCWFSFMSRSSMTRCCIHWNGNVVFEIFATGHIWNCQNDNFCLMRPVSKISSKWQFCFSNQHNNVYDWATVRLRITKGAMAKCGCRQCSTRIMYTVITLCCALFWFGTNGFYAYSWSIPWHSDNQKIVKVPCGEETMKNTGYNASQKSEGNLNIYSKQSTAKHAVCIFHGIYDPVEHPFNTVCLTRRFLWHDNYK